MRAYCLFILLPACFFWSSCEDIINIDLDDAEPKLVIAGEVSFLRNAEVSVSRTVPFSSAQPFDPVSGAEVEVEYVGHQTYRLSEIRPGVYASSSEVTPREGRTFRLRVAVGSKVFTATSVMPDLVNADSIGTTVTTVFGEERKSVALKYQDPPGAANYYRYLWSINGSPFKMVRATDDKFNDGRYVTENLGDFDTELETDDFVVVRMQCIDKATYDFWNAVQSINPGSAAPANPPSVFGDEALGFFSAYTEVQLSTTVQ